MPAYKTIILELLTHQYPGLHEQLQTSRMLLAAVNDYATALRAIHLRWMADLTDVNPHHDPAQLSSEAMELAMEEFQAVLPSASPADADQAPSLSEAMNSSHPASSPPA